MKIYIVNYGALEGILDYLWPGKKKLLKISDLFLSNF